MKTLIAYLVLSTSLAIGTTACAHQQLTNQQVARKALPIAVVIGVIVLAASQGQKNIDLSGARF